MTQDLNHSVTLQHCHPGPRDLGLLFSASCSSIACVCTYVCVCVWGCVFTGGPPSVTDSADSFICLCEDLFFPVNFISALYLLQLFWPSESSVQRGKYFHFLLFSVYRTHKLYILDFYYILAFFLLTKKVWLGLQCVHKARENRCHKAHLLLSTYISHHSSTRTTWNCNNIYLFLKWELYGVTSVLQLKQESTWTLSSCSQPNRSSHDTFPYGSVSTRDVNDKHRSTARLTPAKITHTHTRDL